LLHAGNDAAAALDTLEQALAHAIDAVAAFTAQTPPPGQPATAASAPAGVLLARLLDALDRDDPAPAEALLQELAQVLPSSSLDALRSHLADFDFRGAERATRQLADGLAAGVPG
ncbi:MAG: hypothetical protein RR376_25310, partial [Janthinobacterium sp.]